MSSYLNSIDLFAGAGGLSEGFVREGYNPIAHVEMEKDACDTLRTRAAFHYLRKKKKLHLYYSYLKKEFSRECLYDHLPEELLGSVINAEISNNTIEKIFDSIDESLGSRKVDVILGGPPCQAYSLVGRSRDPNGMRGDKRNFLFRYYGQFLHRYKPKMFVFENVLGLLSAGNKKYLNEMLGLFADLGYSADVNVLDSSDFGVLQTRRRVIIVGRKGKTTFKLSSLEKCKHNWQVKRDLLSDLPSLKPGQELQTAFYTKASSACLQGTGIRNGIDFTTQHICRPHNERDLEIYSIAIDKWLNERKRLKYTDLPKRLQTHKNTGSFLDRFKVVDPYGSSHTVVAHISKDGHYYIFPDLKQVRSISVREAARIQSFPDDFYFEGGRTPAFKQIGNAVPPRMAQALAVAVKEYL